MQRWNYGTDNYPVLIIDVTPDGSGKCVRISAQSFTHVISANSHNTPEKEVSVCPLYRWSNSLGGHWVFCLTPQTLSPLRLSHHWSWKHFFFPVSPSLEVLRHPAPYVQNLSLFPWNLHEVASCEPPGAILFPARIPTDAGASSTCWALVSYEQWNQVEVLVGGVEEESG